MNNQPTPSPEEMAKIEKDRALSDAELLKGGAGYKFDEKGEKKLIVTDEQIEEARKEMEKDKNENQENKEEPKISFPEDINTVNALQKNYRNIRNDLVPKCKKIHIKHPSYLLIQIIKLPCWKNF